METKLNYTCRFLGRILFCFRRLKSRNYWKLGEAQKTESNAPIGNLPRKAKKCLVFL